MDFNIKAWWRAGLSSAVSSRGSVLVLTFLSATVLTCRPTMDKTRNRLLKLDNEIIQVKHRKIIWRGLHEGFLSRRIVTGEATCTMV